MAKKTAKTEKTGVKSRKQKATTTSKSPSATKKVATEQLEAVAVETADPAGDRRRADRRTEQDAVADDRRKVQRRRQIDPTTCERDYTGDEIEFMQAMDAYKRASGRMFPTCSEILEVIRNIGYVRLDEDGHPIESEPSATTEVAGHDGDSTDVDE